MLKKRVVIALSGGVDSSIAALLLHEAGYEIMGVNMYLWSPEEKTTRCGQFQPCYSTQATHDAEQVCLTIGIPFHIINLENVFKQYIIDYFCQEYAQGRTPNPCIACNQHIKFGFLLQHTFSLGADYLATGHYARIEHFNGVYHLLKGIDSNKDQSYMLYTLGQDKLRHLFFPLGNYLKAKVQELAQRRGLPTAGKPSSQDICFTNIDYGTFVSQHITTIPGEIVDKQDNVLGKHRGIAFYTIGQRHGLGLTASTSLYVTKIEPNTNRIIVGNEEDLYSSKLTVSKVNWVAGKPPSEPITVNVKIRYRSPEALATIYPKPDSAEIRFQQPQRAITPGQAAVFYQDSSEVIGGGTIEG